MCTCIMSCACVHMFGIQLCGCMHCCSMHAGFHVICLNDCTNASTREHARALMVCMFRPWRIHCSHCCSKFANTLLIGATIIYVELNFACATRACVCACILACVRECMHVTYIALPWERILNHTKTRPHLCLNYFSGIF